MFKKLILLLALAPLFSFAGVQAANSMGVNNSENPQISFREGEGRFEGGGNRYGGGYDHNGGYDRNDAYRGGYGGYDSRGFHETNFNGNGGGYGGNGSTFIFSGQTDRQYENQLYNNSQNSGYGNGY
jgi:hypothetical protein